MRDARYLAALLIVLGGFALAVPAIALAGGSAGNNQYTNPFGGGSGPASQTTTAPPQTSSTTAAPPSTSAAPSPTPSTSAAPPPTATTATTSGVSTSDPTATAAASSATATTGAGRLPHTGYAEWEVAGFGIVMIAGGLVIRRRRRA
jgi:LPXTG-motif cell wall-anchored protein